MKNIILLVFPFMLLGQNLSITTLVRHYKQKDYAYVCKYGIRLFQELRKDENLLSMYAFSCLKIDFLGRLYTPLAIMGKSAESRRNRSYLSLILAQKNILISAIADGMEFTNLSVPTTDYIISKVFNLYFQKKYKRINDTIVMQDGENRYRLFIRQSPKGYKILVIEEYKDGILQKVHKFM